MLKRNVGFIDFITPIRENKLSLIILLTIGPKPAKNPIKKPDKITNIKTAKELDRKEVNAIYIPNVHGFATF